MNVGDKVGIISNLWVNESKINFKLLIHSLRPGVVLTTQSKESDMIAGLLGEHLASPRTAQKTNQNTALEPKPAPRGESSSKEDFASYVADDPSPNETPRARSEDGPQHSGATQVSSDADASQNREARLERNAEADAKPLLPKYRSKDNCGAQVQGSARD